MTELQTAVIAALGEDKLTFKVGGELTELKVSELPDATLTTLLTYGTRHANDRVNSDKSRGKEASESLSRWIESAKAGTLGQRGGRVTNPVEAECKEIMAARLRDAVGGLNLTDARKKVKANGWQAVADKLAGAYGQDPADYRQEVHNAAKATVEAREGGGEPASLSAEDLGL